MLPKEFKNSMIKHGFMKKEFFILPFDHRTSFVKDILGLEKTSPQNEEKIKELKKIIFQGFLLSLKGKNKKSFGILVDEKYGKNILEEAKKRKIIIALPVEKSGTQELKLEYGSKFKEHINKFRPDYIKILVRYNPKDKNKKSILKKINEFAQKENYKILLELLAPPSKRVETIKEIAKIIKVDVWKLEGTTDKKLWSKIIKAINEKSQIIVLGRGENKAVVEKWLKTAKYFPEIIGFAIGRTIFKKPLIEYVKRKKSKEETADQIADNFNYFLNLWNN